MAQKKNRDVLVAFAIFAAAVVLGILTAALLPQQPTEAEVRRQLDEALALADLATVSGDGVAGPAPGREYLAQNAGEVRGAPLSAPAARADAEAPEELDPETEAQLRELLESSPLGADTEINLDDMTPLRVIPQKSLDLIEQIEGDLTADPDQLLNFERTRDNKFVKLTFAALGSFPYEIPDPEAVRNSANPARLEKQQVPEEILSINEEPVVIVGFMVPIDVDREGRVRSFALTQDQMFCCFGIPPAMNEWMMVEMEEGKSAPFTLDLPIAAYGAFEVGEELEDGYVLSLYRMTASEVIDVQELLRRTGQGLG